jgi:hypothetical protein
MAKSKTKDNQKEIKQLSKELALEKGINTVMKGIRVDDLKNFDTFAIKPNKSLKEECTIITQFGDSHVDEIVNKSVMNGLNEYNPDIAAVRIERYFQRVCYLANQHRRAGTKITNLVLHLAGDFISGWIHEELKETNAMSPIEGILYVQELLLKGIKTIAEQGNFDKVVVIATCGNHARTTDKQRNKNAASTSFEYFMYNNMMQVIAKSGLSNVEFILSESEFIYYKVYDKMNKFSHGNHFNYQGGIGGIEVPIKKWLYREQVIAPFDMAFIGHWHTYIVSNKVRVNGSVIGYNEFGRRCGFPPEPPQMQFQLLDKKRGYTWNCPIFLTDF